MLARKSLKKTSFHKNYWTNILENTEKFVFCKFSEGSDWIHCTKKFLMEEFIVKGNKFRFN